MKNIITPALHVLGGLVGGAIVSLAVTHSIAARRTAPPSGGTSPREVSLRLANTDQNAWLEQRLRRLEETSAAAAAAASASPNRPPGARNGDPATPARDYSASDMLAEQQRHVREYEETIRAHDREPLDAPWADKTARSLSAEMAALAEGGQFAVTGVDCKTTSCKAVFRWPSYAAAIKEGSKLLNHMYEANCTNTIMLPPPPDPNASYEATMLFDCEEWRASQTAQGG